MIINIQSETNLSGFYVVFNRTIANEKNGIYGISHFVEHLISQNLDEYIVEKFQDDGITWNAYTSPTNIVFYMIGLDKYVSKYRSLFLDNLLYLNIRDDKFETEKKSLLEEYTSLFNIQSSSHILNVYRKLFNSYNTIGKKEDIILLTKERCYDYREKYYKTPSKIINVSKYSDFETDVKFNNFENDFHIKYNINDDRNFEIYRSRNKSSIIYLSPVIKDRWTLVFFINYMLTNGLNSALYDVVRKKKGLAYYIKSNLDRLSDFSGINLISTETDDNKVNELMSCIDEIIINKNFLTEEKFMKTKNSIINKIETLNINRYSNVDTYIKPELWTIEKQINNITFEDILKTYDEYFNINRFYKSVDKLEFL